MMAVQPTWGLFRGLIKEIALAIVVLLAAAGVTVFAYMAGQAHTRVNIDAYFLNTCGEVPVYRKAGDGIDSYYVETKLRESDCQTVERFVLWTIPKKPIKK